MNLELTEQEAENLFCLLGMHSTASEFPTFSVYEKVQILLGGNNGYSNKNIDRTNRNFAARQRAIRTDNGLIEIQPEEVPDNPFRELVLVGGGSAVTTERIDKNSFRIICDDKQAVVTISEPEIYDGEGDYPYDF